MMQFAVAFTTTGNSPKEGHRFNEIILIGQENGELNGQHARFKLTADPSSKYEATFPVALTAMKALIGNSEVIVHNAGNWRRFLRVELRSIKRHGASHLMKNVIDVHAWAHQRFPRQRKDVVEIAKKTGIEIPTGLTGLDLEVELLRQIANLMSTPTKISHLVTETVPAHPVESIPATPQTNQRNWIKKLGSFWRNFGMRT